MPPEEPTKEINYENNSLAVRLLIIGGVLVLLSASVLMYHVFYSEEDVVAGTEEMNAENIVQWIPAASLADSIPEFTYSDGNLYFEGEQVTSYTNSLNVAVHDSTVQLPTYAIDRNKLIYIDDKAKFRYISSSVDNDSFTPLSTRIQDDSCGYICIYDAYDKNFRILSGVLYPPLPDGADVSTFTPVYNPDGTFSGFAKDVNYVYYTYHPTIFTILDSSNIGVDINNPLTFESMGGQYYRDTHNIFHLFRENIDVVDSSGEPEKFEYHAHADFARDNNYVYIAGRVVENADPDTFMAVQDGVLYKDKNYVWEVGLVGRAHILENANPQTFSYDKATSIASDGQYVWEKSIDNVGVPARRVEW